MPPGLARGPGRTQGSSAIYGLIPCLLERHLASLEPAEAAWAIQSRQRYTWMWDECVPLAAAEALVQQGQNISGWNRSTYLRDFGHFFFEQLVPRGQAGCPAAEEPLQPRFDVLLGPRFPHLPRGQEWPFPGPLARLEDIQTQLRLCFRSMAGPRWAPAELDSDGGSLTLLSPGPDRERPADPSRPRGRWQGQAASRHQWLPWPWPWRWKRCDPSAPGLRRLDRGPEQAADLGDHPEGAHGC